MGPPLAPSCSRYERGPARKKLCVIIAVHFAMAPKMAVGAPFLLLAVITAATGWKCGFGLGLREDEACTEKGGVCVDWREYVCHAGLETGLCHGDENIRCCLPCDAQCQADEEDWSANDDDACHDVGGLCMHNTNYCQGSYVAGKCGGPAERECCQPYPDSTCPNVEIVSREEWGARPPSGTPSHMEDGVQYLFVHHSAGGECFTKEECMADVRAIQDYHMDSNGWSDIGYSFLIGGDGNVYEGRGWNIIGAHTSGFNDVGYGIDFIGTFTDHNPTEEAQAIYHELASCAADRGAVMADYEMKGHCQTKPTECPGETLYQTIQGWPHWTDGYIGP